MSALEPANLSFVTRMTSSSVLEDKKTEDAVVETKFEGEIGPGVFQEYSKDLERIIFGSRCWEKLKCGQQVGGWIMTLTDPDSGDKVAEVKECVIKDIAIKIGKEDAKIANITVLHKFTPQQKAIECAVSTVVDLSLDRDTEMLPGLTEEAQVEAKPETELPKDKPEKKGKKKKGTKPDSTNPHEDLLSKDPVRGEDPDGDVPEPDIIEMTDDDSDGNVPLGEEQTL